MFHVVVTTALLICGLTWLAKVLSSLKPLETPTQNLRELYLKAWGKPWPNLSIEVVTHEELSHAMALDLLPPRGDFALLHPDFSRFDYSKGSWTETRQSIALQADYLCYNGMRAVKEALYSRSRSEDWDAFVLQSEYEELERELDTCVSCGVKGMVITGQPGICKEYFLIYILLRHLERKQPTAFQLDADRYMIFDAQGVSAFHDKDIPPERLRECMALIDSSLHDVAPCSALMCMTEFKLQVAAPELHRWKKWSTQVGASLFLMEPPSIPEVVALMSVIILPLSESDMKLTWFHAEKH